MDDRRCPDVTAIQFQGIKERNENDGDGTPDLSVFRPSSGQWFLLKPVPGDYDKDGKTDVAVWRPSNGSYFINRSSDNTLSGVQWGANGDIPVAAAPQ